MKTLALALSLMVASESALSEVIFKEEMVNFPAVLKEVSAEVGSTLIFRSRSQTIPNSMELNEDLQVRGKYLFIGYEAKINAGKLLYESNKYGDCFWAQNPIFLKFDTEKSSRKDIQGGICYNDIEDQEDDGEFAFKFVMSSGNNTEDDLPEGFEHKIHTVEKWTPSYFRQELVYSGVAQNVLSIIYREYKDNIARPAFQQDLKYDLTVGDVIGFKGARFRIIGYDNTSIKYVVMEHLVPTTSEVLLKGQF